MELFNSDSEDFSDAGKNGKFVSLFWIKLLPSCFVGGLSSSTMYSHAYTPFCIYCLCVMYHVHIFLLNG